MRLLLLSSSRYLDKPWLVWALPMIREFLGAARTVAFVPYAGVTFTHDEYAQKVGAVFGEAECALTSVHTGEAAKILRDADAIAVGGGNTFQLLKTLQDGHLLDVIREKVRGGTPYIGWSAGSLVTCPNIRTTNDMPIVEPRTLSALGLMPFQINAHYTEATIPNFNGETRMQRLEEFLVLNPTTTVFALPEGNTLRREGRELRMIGEAAAKIYQAGEAAKVVAEGEALDFLLGREGTT